MARVDGPLATAVMFAALGLAAWGGITALLDRPADRFQEAGAALVEAGLVVLTAITLVGMAGGERAANAATFFGYLITTLALLPAGVIMARMEPTRWGSVILGGAALIVPVLVIRLQQVYVYG